MKIAHLKLDNPFILAPLAGYTDLPFRLLCRQYGAGLVFSEMISCHGLCYKQEKTRAMTKTCPEEKPVAIQLFGSDPDMMGQAAAILNKKTIDMIDINMGCPAKKVIKKGAGSALMKDPELAVKIILAVKDNTDLPVSVKFRSGWTHDNITAPDFARMAEHAGADAMTIHGRTWSDGFSGKADWQVIKQVKEAVNVPVIGNGDIISIKDGRAMMAATGCDGVMIGRGSLGRPWVFQDLNEEPGLTGRLLALQRHLDLHATHVNMDYKLAAMKNHGGRYFKGIAHAASIRSAIYKTTSLQDLYSTVSKLIEQFT